MFTRIDPEHRHASRRSSVYARNVVAASQPLAAQAGLQAIRNGGNAVDAAIATAVVAVATSAVTTAAVAAAISPLSLLLHSP